MLYTYTTQPLSDSVSFFFWFAFFVSCFFVSLFYGTYVMQVETDDAIAGTKTTKIPLWKFAAAFSAFVFLSTTYFVITRKPILNEQVIATLVETGDAQYNSGKHSYVKGANVTYKLPDGGLVTFRTDNGSAWYPEITLYKNPR